MSSLDLAVAAAALPDSPDGALAALLCAWRPRRAPLIADLIDRVDRLIRSGQHPISAKTVAEARRQWLSVEEVGDPADVGRLFASVTDRSSAHSVERIKRLAARPPDPRIAAGVMELILQQPCTAPFRPFWTPAFAMLDASADPRVLPSLAERFVAPRLRGEVFDGYLRERVRRVIARFEERFRIEPPRLLDGEAVTVAAIDRRLAALETPRRAELETENRLYAAIWAAPWDDAPRLVLADWLLERGDPRGDFISLQYGRRRGGLARDAKVRERLLFNRYAHEWLGPIAPAINHSGLQFERGFVVKCGLSPLATIEIEVLSLHPAWSTVRQFRVGQYARETRKVLIAHLVRLGAREVDA